MAEREGNSILQRITIAVAGVLVASLAAGLIAWGALGAEVDAHASALSGHSAKLEAAQADRSQIKDRVSKGEARQEMILDLLGRMDAKLDRVLRRRP